jgi:hypothetical protein
LRCRKDRPKWESLETADTVPSKLLLSLLCFSLKYKPTKELMSSTATATNIRAFDGLGPGEGRDPLEAKEGWEDERVEGEAGGDKGDGGKAVERSGWLEYDQVKNSVK